jgi:hypothetical protein
MRLVRLFALLAAAAACLPLATAAANPYPVTSTASTGAGSLRQAIEAANARMGPDSIPIDVTGTIGLENVLPTITDDVTIAGPGAQSLTIERAAGSFRILNFGPGVTATLAGVTVTGGVGPAGAGINNGSGSLTLIQVVVTGNEALADGGTQAVARAGGILSAGPLTLRESFVHGNGVTAGNGSSQTVATGGGVEAFAALTVERSTISGNVVQALGEGGTQVVAKGGGLVVLGGPVAIEESTVSGNSVQAAEGSVQNVAQGGGIQGSGVTLTGSTVTGNSIASDEVAAGANLQHFGTTVVSNSIVSRPLGDADSCNGAISSGGFNIDEGNSCLFDKATDQVGAFAGIDPYLEFNGGPTPTHALFENSPALDRGNSFGAVVDQRGLRRPVDLATKSNSEGGDGSDIGAVEQQLAASPQPSAAAVAVILSAGDRAAPNTRITRGPARVTFKRLAKFRFTSTEPQSTFQCKVDSERWKRCRSPFKRKVGAGRKHVFRVRAIDRFGNVDPTPARFGWRVKALGG